MQIKIKKCKVCGAMPFGAHPVKLMPWEGVWICDKHMREALDWHEIRPSVIRAVESYVNMLADAQKRILRTGYLTAFTIPGRKKNWTPYLQECAGMAELALLHDDRRTFVHYFSRALYAHTLAALEV